MPATLCGPTCGDSQQLTSGLATLALNADTSTGVNLNAAGSSGGAGSSTNKAVLVNISLAVPYYSQLDQKWPTLGGSGCLITCMAMILAYYGCQDEEGKIITPGTLNTYLATVHGLSGGAMKADVAFTFGDKSYRRTKGPSQAAAMKAVLLQELVAKRPAIAQVSRPGQSSHFVVVIGTLSNDNHLMNDPGRSPLTNKKGVTTYRGYGADPGHLTPTPDSILEQPAAKGGQGYGLIRVDTVQPA